MTALEIPAVELRLGPTVQARPAPPLRDVASIAGRALRRAPRELETVLPPAFIALFFFVVNIGTLQHLTQSNIKGFDIKSFMLPTAVLLGVTGVSRAGSLVLDIQDGYLDRLLLTPVRRLAILVGHMAADVAIACTLMVPITALALALGAHFRSGPLGVAFFFLLGRAVRSGEIAGSARTVRVRDDHVLVTDGPFAETKEQIAGFDILECADLDEAIDAAAKHPVSRIGAMEVRPFWPFEQAPAGG